MQLMKTGTLAWTVVTVLTGLLCTPMPATGQSDTTLDDRIETIFEAWNSTHSPGGVVGIVRSGRLIHQHAFGMASLEHGIPNRLETVFNIASVSKQFTAYAVLLLARDGRLSLDDDVRTYLPEVPDFGSRITLRHMLTHTSGLRNFQSLLMLAGWRDSDHMTGQDLLRYIERQRELNFPPGSEHLYCNSGFNLMAEIVARVTGQSFVDWTRANIFEPLGMNDTEFREDLDAVQHGTAASYEGPHAGEFRYAVPWWSYVGNGNVYTTLDDLAKWIAFLQAPGVERLLVEQLTEPAVLTNGDTIPYGLGIRLREYRGLRRVYHTGSIGGYRAFAGFFPDHDLGIVVLANFSGSNPLRKAMQVAELYLEEHMAARSEPEASEPPPAGWTPSLRELHALTGRYYSPELDTAYHLRVADGGLVAEHRRHGILELRPHERDVFRGPFVLGTVRIERASDGSPESIRVTTGDDRARDVLFVRESDDGTWH